MKKASPEKLNKRIGKLETAVLAIFGLSLIFWILNRLVNMSIFLTLSFIALGITSVLLLASIIKAILDKTAKKRK